MKLSSCILPLALTLLVSCGPNADPATATTQAPVSTSPATEKPAAAPGDSCSVPLSNIVFTRTLNGAAKNVTTTPGKLTLSSDAKRDNFNDPDGKLTNNTAPILLTEIDNRQPFTFTTKVTPTFLDMYDAGVLYVYLHEKLWQKFAFERDERTRTRIVSVRTIGTSDDNNHDLIRQPYVHLKISSDTKTIGFYYSLDGKGWELVRLYKNDYPATIWLGISTQSPVGQGTSAQFEQALLTATSIEDFRLGI